MALRALWRDFKSGELAVVGVAAVLAVASICAVDLFAARVRESLTAHANALLAADLAVSSTHPIRGAHRRLARDFGLASVRVAALRSVVAYGDVMQLVELKAVEPGYPLHGRLQIAAASGGTPVETGALPDPGTVWADAQLLQALGARVGNRVEIGTLRATIAAVLVFEPDRGGDLFSIAPRILMPYADVPRTGLVSAGSHVQHTLLVAGERAAIARFRAALSLDTGERIVDPRVARPEIRAALDRAEQYLSLASLCAVILAGVAMALAAQAFAARHVDACALLKTLGATPRFVATLFAVEVGLLAILAATAGAVIGLLANGVLADAFGGWLRGPLPPAPPSAALRGVLVGLTAIGGFALPPLIGLRHVPPMRILRRDPANGTTGAGALASYGIATAILVAPWHAGDWSVTAWMLVAAALCLALLGGAAFLVLAALGRVSARLGIAWRFGILNVTRRARLSAVQTAALGLGLMALLVIGLVRNELIDQWRNNLPANAPNRFLVNIQPADVEALARFFRDRRRAPPEFHPMVRARLVAINQRRVDPADYADPRARGLADREFNLSAAQRLKADNRVVAGHWWARPAAAQFSVETGVAEALGIKLGDVLTYRIAERTLRASVTSLRAVDWGTLQANFFVIAPPGVLDAYPTTYMAGFALPPGDARLLSDLVRAFPSVTVIDVEALIAHVRRVMDQVSAAVAFVCLFTLASGILVLVAALQSSRDARLYDAVILKTLGASRGLLVRALLAELLTLGAVAGAVAGIAAQGAGWLLASRVLHLAYEFDAVVVVAGIGAGIAGAVIAGTLAIYPALSNTVTAGIGRTI